MWNFDTLTLWLWYCDTVILSPMKLWLCDIVRLWRCDMVTLWHGDILYFRQLLTFWLYDIFIVNTFYAETFWPCHILTLIHFDTLKFDTVEMSHVDNVDIVTFHTVTQWYCDYLTLWDIIKSWQCHIVTYLHSEIKTLTNTIQVYSSPGMSVLVTNQSQPQPSWTLTGLAPGHHYTARYYSVQCTMYSAKYTVCSVQCTVYSV